MNVPRPHRFIFLIALALLFVSSSPAGSKQTSFAYSITGKSIYEQSGVRIISSDESQITLEFTPHLSYWDTIRYSGGEAVAKNEFLLPHFLGEAWSGYTSGMPDARSMNVLVLVPAVEGTRLEVQRVEQMERVGDLAPVPYVESDGHGLQEFRFVFSDSLRRVSGRFPGAYVELAPDGVPPTVGRLVTLRFYPIQYERASHRIFVVTRIVATLYYGKSVGYAAPQLDPRLASVVINWKSTATQPPAVAAQRRGAPGHSVLATGEWFRIEISDEGMYRLDYNALKSAGIDVDNLDPRTLKIYGNGGRELPQSLAAPRIDDLAENAIEVVGESDGKFDPTDYVIFYGASVRGWEYDPAARRYHHYLNHYTERNVYWLTYGGQPGKRMQQLQSLSDPDPYRPASFTDYRTVEEEKTKTEVKSGLDWFGEELKAQFPSIVYTTKLDGIVSGSTISYDVMLVGRASAVTHFDIQETDSLIGRLWFQGVSFSDQVGMWAWRSEGRFSASASRLQGDRSLLRFVYYPNSDADLGFIDWFEIFYQRRFVAVNDVLHFRSPDMTATVEYTVTGFSNSDIHVFDVTDFANSAEITNAYVSGSTIRFQAGVSSGSPHEYIAVGPAGYLSPSSISRAGNSDLHGIIDGAQMVIITHPLFMSEANRLKAHRESFAENRLSTMVVNVFDIYNEFGGGLPDPTAIRDFLKYAYDHWSTRPEYALLFGEGEYDYKNITGASHVFVPVYETPETLYQIESYTSDDYFVLLTPDDRRIDMAIGRIPVRTPDEARAVVDKIIAYESQPEFGMWKDRVTFVADDGLTSYGDDGSEHTRQSDELAESFTPALYEKLKIYLIEYPTVIGASGRLKPDVNKAIIDQINEGTLVMNWTGHGNPHVWAHEHVFENSTTIPQLVNKNRLTFFTAATCDFGRYDDPEEQSGAELLVLKPDGGGIGVMTATRAVYGFLNAIFANAFYQALFMRDSSGLPSRIGDALFLVKQTRFETNDRKFQLIGDPSMRLAAPRLLASVDSINGRASDSSWILRAGGFAVVRGSIHTGNDPNSTVLQTYDGTGSIMVHDAFRTVTVPEWAFTFRVLGGTLFHGRVSVNGGTFKSEFIVPRDLSYEKDNGRISFYFSNDHVDGCGYTQSVAFSGVDTSVNVDTVGPQVAIFIGDRNFRDGDVVGENTKLIVDLYDEHGMNLSSAGVGHQLQAWLDQSDQGIDLSNYYTGELNSYQHGTVEYPLRNLSDGEHTVSVRAWDVFNNSTTTSAAFRVARSASMQVFNVVNYPNPFKDRTTFTLQQNQSSPVDVTIKIYTVAGRLIATLQENGLVGNFLTIGWDGRDQDGNEIANGVYLYKVIIRTSDGGLSTEVLGKLAKVQ